jgi:hypothetical protein
MRERTPIRLSGGGRAPIMVVATSDRADDVIGRALCGLEVFSWIDY